MSKPREWWINDNAEGDGSKNWSDTPWFGYIHVIEKSAYDALAAENEYLKSKADEATKFMKGFEAQVYEASNTIRELCTANAELLEALKFYADKGPAMANGACIEDGGALAEQALAKHGGGK